MHLCVHTHPQAKAGFRRQGCCSVQRKLSQYYLLITNPKGGKLSQRMSQLKTWFTEIWQIKGPQLNKLACANIWANELDGNLNYRDHISKQHPKLELHKKEPPSSYGLFPPPCFLSLRRKYFSFTLWETIFFFFFSIHMLAFSFLMTALGLISCCQTCTVKARGCVFVFPCTCTAQFQRCHFYKAWCNPSQEQCKTKARCLWSDEASLPCCGTYVQGERRKKISCCPSSS